jgi:dipeptidyl aminopeptidase/acylaminoacyl peptidase
VNRDIRATTLYSEIERHYRKALEPGFGHITGADDLAPAPNGRLIAFTGTRLEALENAPEHRICLVDDKGHVDVITGGPNDDRLPAWSPDCGRLAFASDRNQKERFGLYLLEAGRMGEAIAAPTVPGSVESLEWSADGTSVLLLVADEGADVAGALGSGTMDDAHDVPEWMPEVSSTHVSQGWRRLWIYDPTTNEVRPASREGLNVWEAAWAGGGSVAAIASEGPSEDTWYESTLVVVDPSNGHERTLLKSEVQLGVPASSPSGHRIAVIQALCSDRLAVAGDVLVVSPEDGGVTEIDTAGVDVTDLHWRTDERLLYAGVRDLDTVVGEHDFASGRTNELWASSETCGNRLCPRAWPHGDDSFVAVVHGFGRYPEITWVQDGRERALTSFAHEGSEYLRRIGGSMEQVSWRSFDGLEIHGLLCIPETPRPHPLVAFVHGGPVALHRNYWSMRDDDIPFLVRRGYAVLFPNVRGSTGRGQRFVRMVYGDMGGGDARDIMSGVEALIERGVADRKRIGVMGGSYGGFMASWLVTQSDLFAAAVAISPVTDWYSQHFQSNIGFFDAAFLQDKVTTPGGSYLTRSPVMFAGNVRTPTLLTAGAIDRCTPPGQAVEFHRALVEHGGETELVLYPKEGHGVRSFPAIIDFCTRIVDWFDRHMAPDG